MICSLGFVKSVPVNNLLEVGTQEDDQLLEGAPLFDIKWYLLLILLVLVLVSQRYEDQRAFLDDRLAERVQVLAVLRRDILESQGKNKK